MKKILKIFISIIAILILMLIIDLLSIFIFSKPLFAIKVDNGDSVNIVYKGLFYDTYNCHEFKNPKIKFKTTKYSCAISKIDIGKVIGISDTTNKIENFTCAEALENFFEDDDYNYYWNCIKDNYMIVRYESGFEETISNALKNKTITINDLDKYKINYIKQEKDIPNKDFEISIVEEDNCNLKLKKYYKYNERTIYTSCLKEIYIERDNNKKMTLKYHLENINQSFDRSIKQLISDATIDTFLKDGGTKVYKKDNYTIIKCNTIDGNKDIYIGNKDFKYEQGFCK